MNKKELKELYPKMSEQFMETVNKSVSEGLKDNGKVIKMKKRIFTVLAATFLIGVSVYASGRAVGVLSTSNSLTEFADADEIEKRESDIGLDFKHVDEFKNGYMFKKGWITNSSGIDENGVKLDNSKELTMVYSNNKNDMYLIVGPNNTDDGTADREITASSQIYKNLPVDYEMTEQDIEDQKNGVYVFSVGTEEEEVTETEMQFVSWHEDGVNYLIMQYGNEVSLDEMKEMAGEIIEAE